MYTSVCYKIFFFLASHQTSVGVVDKQYTELWMDLPQELMEDFLSGEGGVDFYKI